MALCILIDGAVFVSVEMFGGVISVVVITLDRYWKIVHPIHHRKYYRRWMVKGGLIIPWLSGVETQIAQFARAAIIEGKCFEVRLSRSAEIVSSGFILSSLKFWDDSGNQ